MDVMAFSQLPIWKMPGCHVWRRCGGGEKNVVRNNVFLHPGMISEDNWGLATRRGVGVKNHQLGPSIRRLLYPKMGGYTVLYPK